ncbi:MAG: hypothetical protein M1827_002654 [Pycnora praestabilis]|nr:MAG: hypothetical protein M1827_002654 [Pycnora praestabilis]
MPADRLLGTLLRSLQTSSIQQDTPRLLSTAGSLLLSLTNPLNITLLTSQLLTAPAIWDRPDGLQTCLRVLGIFHSISRSLAEQENHVGFPDQQLVPCRLKVEDWVKAVVKGADERSPRWRHPLVIGGLVLGFGGHDRNALSHRMTSVLQGALVTATNLALTEVMGDVGLEGHCIVMVINHTFELLSDGERAQINYNYLLPVLMGSAFFSSEGLQSGYFLGIIDADITQVAGKKFTWSAKSSTFFQVKKMSSRPLVSSMGPLSRLIAHCADNVSDPSLLHTLVDDLSGFARTLTVQWRQNKLSEIDISEEPMFLDQEALTTLPVLWQILKTAMFATVVVLRGIMGRILSDQKLAADESAPTVATRALDSLRNLYFISSRLGSNAFSQYTFVSLTAIDILSKYPYHAEAFLIDIRPCDLGRIPGHPLDRCLDLYFLNTAEYFTLVLPLKVNEDLLVAAATPYLASGGNNHLLEIFEAAHSVMLAVLAAPQSADLAAKHLPFYVDALFKVFPQNLSSRQFRLAFKTLLRITTPPSPLSASQPFLPSILLELLYHRALHASSAPLPPPITGSVDQGSNPNDVALSEQVVLTLTLLDTFQFLPVNVLTEWLPLVADLVNIIDDEGMARTCRERFWEVLSSGELDVERAEMCVAWWSTRGGRETVLFRRVDKERGHFMSGVLNHESRL